MGYSRDIIIAAEGELLRRKTLAENEAEKHKNDFALLEPEYFELKRKISSAGISAARIVLSRKSDAKEELEKLKNSNLEMQNQVKMLLKKHNLPENYLTPDYVCKSCGDSGYVNGYMCDCFKKLMRKMAFERLNSKTPLSLSTFDSFKLEYYPDTASNSISPRERMGKILTLCKKYAEGFTQNSGNLLFLGKTGLGKTHLSLAIANEVVLKGYGVVYGSVQSFLRQIEREHFGKDNKGENTLQSLIDCDLLILDDLGSEFSTQFTVSVIYDIINSRMLTGRPVIISTNLDLSEMEQRYTERVVSRIIGSYRLLQFDGVDIRSRTDRSAH